MLCSPVTEFLFSVANHLGNIKAQIKFIFMLLTSEPSKMST